ncbi:MAG TPA: DUF4870 domain-containing protein [Vicinamibacteria bacterium]|nr:DUF4870 domain-containing protein [Vicinamibacteria bacterium]
MRRLAAALWLWLLWTAAAAAQTPPAPPPAEAGKPPDLEEMVDALLGGLMGAGPTDAATLQKEVEEAGGIRFRRDVPVAFLTHAQLGGYLRELFDEEYPEAEALADQRLLSAFDLLPAGTDLRALRARVLEENVAGFYDDRPGKQQLYAVSESRSLTPMNQIVLAHEMRHALQDQYADLHALVSDSRSDFDDRRLAVMALFEGDATLVMERFLRQRLGSLGSGLGGGGGEGGPDDAGAAALAMPGLFDVPGAPPIVRDQLVQPYLTGLAFARALWERGGAEALRGAWSAPPASTEQVLHPAHFFAHLLPRAVSPRLPPPGGARLVSEGVFGELLLRTLVEGDQAAAEGWAGDGWRLWDVGGRTALLWRSEWASPSDAGEFHQALRRRFARHHAATGGVAGWEAFGEKGARAFALRRDGDAVELASADDAALLGSLLGATARPALEDPAWSGLTSPAVGIESQDTSTDADQALADREVSARGSSRGGEMATSTPPGAGNQTNLGMAPNVAGLLCYVPCCIGLIFSIVAVIVEKQSRFVRFHAFQSLLLHAAAIVLGVGASALRVALAFTGLGFIGLLLSLVQIVVGFGLLALTIVLMIKANSGEEFELPVIGPMARNWV